MTGRLRKKEELISDAMSDRIIETAERIATSEGAHTVTVRKILKELGITNRVFYNRFRNVDDVLAIVYKNMVVKIRRDILSEYHETQDFLST